MTLNGQIALRFAILSLFFASVMIGHTVFSFAMVTPDSSHKWFYNVHPEQSKLDAIEKILDSSVSFLETENLIEIFHGIESNWKTIGLLAGIPFSTLNEIEYSYSDDQKCMSHLVQIMQHNQVTVKQLALAIYMPCGGNSLAKAQYLMQQTPVFISTCNYLINSFKP